MSDEEHDPARPAAGAAGPLAAMLAAVVVAGTLPYLGFRQFYLSGDSIAQWLPANRRIGDLLLDGESHLMDPTLWRGGNFVAEARFGVWNPVALLLDVTVLQLDDLAVVTLLVSVVYLVLLATGTFLLAREYGAPGWPAALAGLVVATGGWTLWMDAAWWTPHLASFAFTPYVWVAARRLVRGASGPGWLVLAGWVCVTAGNPYSNVVIVVIAVAVAAEVGRRRDALLALLGSLLAIGLVALFVYLPFRQTSVVGFRESGLFNDESWSPGAGDFLVMSSPTATPFVRNFGRESLGFPGFHLAWFALPLAPWLRWRTLARRDVAGLGVATATLFVLALGPSNLWFFRWPMRLIPYLYLPLVVAASVVIGRGLVTDRVRARATASGAIVVGGAYLAWADVPGDLGWHVLAAAVVLAAMVATVYAARRRPMAVAPTMLVATLVVLVVQLQWQPRNDSVRHYGLPAAATAYEARFGAHSAGNLVQVAAFDAIPPPDRTADAAYRDLAVGSTLAIAGVESVSQYSGIGFGTHDAALCLKFDGATCAAAWDRLWQPAGDTAAPLADLLRAETVVAQRSLVETAAATPPPGWSRAEVTEHVVVWRRDEPLRWSDGRLSEVSGPVVVDGDRADGPHRETVTMRRTGDGPVALTFGRLAWPGYEATIAGRPLLVGGGPAGLLTVSVPADVGGAGEPVEVLVTWRPPYWKLSLLIAALGLAVGLATQLAWVRRARHEI